MSNWEEGVNNTKSIRISDEYVNCCRKCDKLTEVTGEYTERQLLGNCYQSLVKCKECGTHLVLDEYKIRMRNIYLQTIKTT